MCYAAIMAQVPRVFVGPSARLPEGFIPAGNVAWVQRHLGRPIPPEYVPPFLGSWLHRKVWTADQWPPAPAGGLPTVFVKPADRYKRFAGRLYGYAAGRHPKGPFWCSEPVAFINEWRYYVARGQVLAAHWYKGDEAATPAPPTLPIQWPGGWCGAADFGQLEDGRIALVEALHPFAWGLYCRTGEGSIYILWLSEGWDYLRSYTYS